MRGDFDGVLLTERENVCLVNGGPALGLKATATLPIVTAEQAAAAEASDGRTGHGRLPPRRVPRPVVGGVLRRRLGVLCTVVAGLLSEGGRGRRRGEGRTCLGCRTSREIAGEVRPFGSRSAHHRARRALQARCPAAVRAAERSSSSACRTGHRLRSRRTPAKLPARAERGPVVPTAKLRPCKGARAAERARRRGRRGGRAVVVRRGSERRRLLGRREQARLPARAILRLSCSALREHA